jgi:Rrf2 family transcriptional regulator, nitric oxide-sensitive transcriptional repressor
MRLTTYTDYTLRVLIYLTLKYKSGEKTTIQEIADSYEISRNHLMKIVHELSQHGIIETSRGRAGGLWLARAPAHITVGEVVRLVEPDMAIVQCHEVGQEQTCAAWRACNLTRGFRRALDAFLRELDAITMEDAVTVPRFAATVLGLGADGRKVVPLAVIPYERKAPAGKAVAARRAPDAKVVARKRSARARGAGAD